jgi:amidohydrolase
MNILELTKEIETEAIRIRREVHKNPELSLKEYKTSDFLEKELKKIGIEVSREGLKTGVLGILRGKKPGKTIALRADIDVLPIAEETGLEFASQNEGVMHACGLELHLLYVIIN